MLLLPYALSAILLINTISLIPTTKYSQLLPVEVLVEGGGAGVLLRSIVTLCLIHNFALGDSEGCSHITLEYYLFNPVALIVVLIFKEEVSALFVIIGSSILIYFCIFSLYG